MNQPKDTPAPAPQKPDDQSNIKTDDLTPEQLDDIAAGSAGGSGSSPGGRVPPPHP